MFPLFKLDKSSSSLVHAETYKEGIKAPLQFLQLSARLRSAIRRFRETTGSPDRTVTVGDIPFAQRGVGRRHY
jgi:hypothetical protein